MYRLGSRGREELDRILLDSIQTVHSFYGDYLLSLRPEIDVFEDIFMLLTDELDKGGNVAYLAVKDSTMHRIMLLNLQKRVPQGKVHFVKPPSVVADLTLEDLVVMNGTYDDIPLKDGFADLLVVIDLPKEDLLEAALREWHRVIGQNGKLTIMTPTILVHRYRNPLTIGQFIEKYEHETIEKGVHVDRELLQTLLKTLFKKVGERVIVHMTIILAYEPCSLRQQPENL